MSTPITGDLPVELLHRLPAWTIAIPMTWTPKELVAFVTVDAATTSLDGVAIDDAGLDQLLIMFVTTDELVVPFPIELGAGSIADQLARNAIIGNLNVRPTRLNPVSMDEGPGRLGIDMSVSRLLERTIALMLYLCSEEPDVTTVPTPVTVAPPRPPRGPTRRSVEVLDVGQGDLEPVGGGPGQALRSRA